MKALHTITFGLLIIGGLNWGLEFFGWGIASFVPMGLAQLIYILVGISAVIQIFTHKNYCRYCVNKMDGSMGGSMGKM